MICLRRRILDHGLSTLNSEEGCWRDVATVRVDMMGNHFQSMRIGGRRGPAMFDQWRGVKLICNMICAAVPVPSVLFVLDGVLGGSFVVCCFVPRELEALQAHDLFKSCVVHPRINVRYRYWDKKTQHLLTFNPFRPQNSDYSSGLCSLGILEPSYVCFEDPHLSFLFLCRQLGLQEILKIKWYDWHE